MIGKLLLPVGAMDKPRASDLEIEESEHYSPS